MQNRKQDIDRPREIGRCAIRLRQDREPPRAARNERDARSALGNRGRKLAVLNRAQEPGPGPGDADRDGLVARRIERAEYVSGGQHGDIVLGRAAAEQQRDPQPLDHDVVSRIDPLWRDFAETAAIGQPATRGSAISVRSREQRRSGARWRKPGRPGEELENPRTVPAADPPHPEGPKPLRHGREMANFPPRARG